MIPAAGRAGALRHPARGTARRRLFCFPFAGGGATAFREWPSGLAADIELVAVQLPGREARLRERAFAAIAETVEACLPIVAAGADLPFALFGHSMGAILAFETALALAASGTAAPAHVFLSARRPPDEADVHPPIAGLPDDAFIEALQTRYGAIPETVRREPDLLALFLPTLRADIGALERHVFSRGQLACPLHVYGGTDDHQPRPDQLDGWQRFAAATIRVRLFAGDHFFIAEQRAAILADIDRAWPGQDQPPQAASPALLQLESRS